MNNELELARYALMLTISKSFDSPLGPVYESNLVPKDEIWILMPNSAVQKVVNIGTKPDARH